MIILWKFIINLINMINFSFLLLLKYAAFFYIYPNFLININSDHSHHWYILVSDKISIASCCTFACLLCSRNSYSFCSRTNFIKWIPAFFIGNNADNRFDAKPSQKVCHFQFEILSKFRHANRAMDRGRGVGVKCRGGATRLSLCAPGKFA